MKNEFSPFSAEWCLQLQNNPIVVALRPTAFGLPPIAHVDAPAGEKKVILCAKVLVGAGHCDAAHDRGAEFEDGGGGGGVGG